MKICKCCKFETEQLFALFDKGSESYCSDCQMEAENEIQENESYQSDCGVGPVWEGF